MASLGLKLFYLRTREKKLSQKDVAAQLGVRQATISNLEQENTAPHWALVVELCQFYDVTPTFLSDDARGVVPLPTERWGLRNALVTLGMSIEVAPDAIHELDGCDLGGWMVLEVSSNKTSIPRPLILRVRRGVHADVSSARLNVPFKGGLLPGVENVPRCV